MNNKLNEKQIRETFTSVNCSPSNSNNSYTCYSDVTLMLLKNEWNSSNNPDKITTSNPKKIWLFFKEKFKKDCSDEICFLNPSFISQSNKLNIINETFAPIAPKSWSKNINEWLSDDDISKVLNQYEKKYSNYKSLGPSAIDYDTIIYGNQSVCNKLSKFDLSVHKNNKIDYISVVFNLDKHNKSGSHWVCLFMDLIKHHIYYFNSTGSKIPKNIKQFVKKIQDQSNGSYIFKQNYPVNHQKGNTECGMYVLYFIIELLTKKKTFDYFMDYKISDKEIEKYRYKYFNIVF